MSHEAAAPALAEQPHRPTRAEAALALAGLALMSALPLAEIAGRKVLGRGIPGSIPIVQHLTLWITFIGAGMAAASDRLLALSTATFLPQRVGRYARLVTSALGAGAAVWLAIACVRFIDVERAAGEMAAWGVPVWVAVLVMPAGFAVMAARMIRRGAASTRGRCAGVVVAALPLVFAWTGVEGLALPVGVAIAAAAALGMPIFAALGIAALLMFASDAVPLASAPAQIYRLSASPLLPALPLFTLGGYLFTEGGASRRLMRVFTALVGWMPGGLAMVVVLLLAFFTPFTGASGVTILSMGGLILPMLVKARYPENTAMGLVTVSGSIGILFAPSLPVILYGIYARTAIDELFLAGLIPGFILIAAVAAWAAWRGWRAGAVTTPFRAKEAAAALWGAKWELALPAVVLAGIAGGFATLVEAAALTVLYAFVIEVWVYRELGVKRDLPRVAAECATLVGGFLVIVGAAFAFTGYLIQAEVPMLILAWVKAHIHSPWVFLLALNGFLLVVGAVMDIYSAILVIVPLIAPIGVAYGIDPVHLGIVFLANMELGYLMPPMGENLFLSAYRFQKPLARVYLSTVPYSLMLLAAVLLITYLPLLRRP
ncbi:MAG: TRAP transporter large permease subunit [Bryobacteraceae bacterium]